jgi:hypothetical protein
MTAQTKQREAAVGRVADPPAYTIAEFCAAHRISRSQFYKLRKAGQGPRIKDVGKQLITGEAAAAWRRRP